MADRTSLARGVDPYYYQAQAGQPGAQRQPGDYYMSAHREGGEPPGRWWGPGAEALGFGDGQEVEKEPYERVFADREDPRDGSPLGRKPGRRQETERLVHELRKTMPHATAEELHRVRVAAAQKAGAGPLYIDMTNGFSKSISLFHASIGENARLAEARGDRASAACWAGHLEAMDEMIYDAVQAGFGYFQREAGYVRTGHHGGRVRDQDTGKWQEAELAVVLWLQHTSRDEDPQLHIHGQILHAARTVLDGKWRAPDSRGYGEFTGAVSAIVSAHLESAMTRRFGVAWTPRKDGMGREISGISEKQMELFSQRRASITEQVREWAREYERTHDGRKPTQRMLQAAADRAGKLDRKAKPEGKLDMRSMLATWAQKMRGAGLGELAAIAPGASGLGPGKEPERAPAAGPTREELERAGRQALDLVQQDRPTWTRADLIRCLGLVMPASAQQLPPEAAVALLDDLAGQALAGQFERVTPLDAPAVQAVPAELRRRDGKPVYERHGGSRYALASHLAREAALVETAQAQRAPRMERADAAAHLVASVEALETALRERASDAGDARTATGLRMDQAAALYYALTAAETVTIVTGPAGSGKTHVLAEAAKIWPGEVIGVTPSSSSRNVLAAASGGECYNSAQFLGHLREGREALGIYAIKRGTLIMLDEASMMSQPDIEAIVQWAADNDSKVLMSGDQEQLEAVESGGGMALLAGRLGFAQLAVPVRFAEQWERDASLRLRAGDAGVLTEYDQHGRVIGGDPESLLDKAAQLYTARYLTGTDVLMMAMSHDDCRELSRRVRDDLVHLGLVDGGRSAPLSQGARASAGDLIIARDNANRLEAGEPGRTLANGDTLRVERVNPDGSMVVRRALDADRETGARRYTDAQFTLPAGEAVKADLAYAVTGHSAQGRTVGHGLAVFRGNETRGWTYVALSRAAESNTALVATAPAKADLQAAGRPDPELDRYDRVQSQRQARQPDTGAKDTTAEALGILATCIERRGSADAALDVQRQELSDADHLMRLRIIFENETAGPREERYAGMLRDALAAAEYPVPVMAGHTDRWLYRTLEAAELAGRDPRQVLDRALAQGPLEGARDVVAVIDARARKITGPMVPQQPAPWSERVPRMSSPAMQVYVDGVARAMDDRGARLGEHTAQQAPGWALRGLGPVPDDGPARKDWERRASAVAAYREAYGYTDAAEPIGPEPATANPQQRAAWHGALAALGPVDGIDVRGISDGALLNARAVFERETAWAPTFVADELRQVRVAATSAELAAVRADAEAKAASMDAELAARHAQLASSSRELGEFYRATETELAGQMQVRREWAEATEHARRTALAADSEYRRRHPEEELADLRNAEPDPVTAEERGELETGQRPAWLDRLAQGRRAAQAELDERRSLQIPSEDPDADYDGAAWPEFAARQRDAVLQPPKPEIQPAASVTEAARQPEAGS